MGRMKTEKLDLARAYRLLNHGPTVLVSTTDGAVPNAAAIAWCAPASRAPARFVLTIGTRHKTWDNLTASGECVINLPTVEALEQLWVCGHRTGHHGDKLGPAGIEVMPSTVVEAPRLTCCVAWIEAELVQAPLYEGTSLVLVEAVAVETVPGLIDEAGHLDVTRFHTLHHLGGPRFTLPGEVIEHK